MKEILTIIKEIDSTEDCSVINVVEPISLKDFGYEIPGDLVFYLKNYKEILLFENSEYPFRIVGFDTFVRANPVIVGEDVEDDISHNWYIIATAPNSQYITIDLAHERLGKCYDSFWDRYGLVGDQPIIALSFTELLKRLLNAKGEKLFWLEDNFESYGDAYD